MQNEMLTKKRKKHFTEHSTAANPPPKAHARKAQRRRVCVSANVQRNQKKAPVLRLNEIK
jgi:hypothetical protein